MSGVKEISTMTGLDFGLDEEEVGAEVAAHVFIVRDVEGDCETLIRTADEFVLWILAMGWECEDDFIEDTGVVFEDCENKWCFQMENRVYADEATTTEMLFAKATQEELAAAYAVDSAE